MGPKSLQILVIYGFSLICTIECHPVGNRESQESAFLSSVWPLLLMIGFVVTSLVFLLGCLSCCKQQAAGFKEFHNEGNGNSVGLDFVNPLQNVVVQSSSSQPESIIAFEPLPSVLAKSSNKLPSYRGQDEDSIINEWFGDKDFPRQQLHYIRECGQGWFGKVVEGEARGLLSNSNKISRVYVRILKEDASSNEQALFLLEAKPYKELSHPNVLKLLGKCVENIPLLLLFESCPNGDLKSYLRQNVGNREALIFQGIILRMAIDVASGLSYMLQNTFVHTDIAARNCLVTNDLRVKVGDYGTSLQMYKDEYYFTGDIALPIRWCAPETLQCTETTIHPQQVTGASCIWSYGVLLWELEEWGELPYKELSDDQVITRVFGNEGLRLPCPLNQSPYSQEMYSVMCTCWREYADRPSFIHVMNALSALLHRFKNNDFDARWRSLKPNSIPIMDNEAVHHRFSNLSNKGDSDSGIDLDNSRRGISVLQQSPLHQADFLSDSPCSSRRFSSSSAVDVFSSSSKQRSPSLENLHGSNVSLNKRGDDESEWTGRLDFQLGPMSVDAPWNNDQPLFRSESMADETLRRVDSMCTDAEEEHWRKRIERGEFTEKVKEKSKSVADLMVLTHIECSESSESDSMPSFHSRQSSFNRQVRRNAPSLLTSLSFGSENNLPLVEDEQFHDALKKIQIAKINKDEDLMSLQQVALRLDAPSLQGSQKTDHFLVNAASEPHQISSQQVEWTGKLPLVNSESESDDDRTDSVVIGPSECDTLEYFKGLKTILLDGKPELTEKPVLTNTLNEYLNDTGDDYYYNCDSACTCDKFRTCQFQSDDSGRGTDQINSGDGSDKSLEGSISVQMNEVKSRLEDVIAKFAVDTSSNSCSSLEDDENECDFVFENEVAKKGKQDRYFGTIEDETANEKAIIDTENYIQAENETTEEVEKCDENICYEPINIETIPHEDNISEIVKYAKILSDEDSKSDIQLNFDKNDEDQTLQCGTLIEEIDDVTVGSDEIPSTNALIEEPDESNDITSSDVKVDQFYFKVGSTLKSDLKLSPAEYDICDILEGLSEPISLPYSVNDDEATSWCTPLNENKWNENVQSLDTEESSSFEMSDELAEAIRNELREKLPNPLVVEQEEDNDKQSMTIEYGYPTQLSPILEEDESSGSFNDDPLHLNDALLSDSSSFTLHKLNETYDIDTDSDLSYTPDSVSPGTSSKTGAQLSYSSSESGNLSDVFLSPTCSKDFEDGHPNTPKLTPVRSFRLDQTTSLTDCSMSDVSEAEIRSLPADINAHWSKTNPFLNFFESTDDLCDNLRIEKMSYPDLSPVTNFIKHGNVDSNLFNNIHFSIGLDETIGFCDRADDTDIISDKLNSFDRDVDVRCLKTDDRVESVADSEHDTESGTQPVDKTLKNCYNNVEANQEDYSDTILEINSNHRKFDSQMCDKSNENLECDPTFEHKTVDTLNDSSVEYAGHDIKIEDVHVELCPQKEACEVTCIEKNETLSQSSQAGDEIQCNNIEAEAMKTILSTVALETHPETHTTDIHKQLCKDVTKTDYAISKFNNDTNMLCNNVDITKPVSNSELTNYDTTVKPNNSCYGLSLGIVKTDSSPSSDLIGNHTDDLCPAVAKNQISKTSKHSSSSTSKTKNSLALFGNGSKQIRNFQVSVVEDDKYKSPSPTSPKTPDKLDRFLSNRLSSPNNSERTWRTPVGIILSSRNLENFDLEGDTMSTSFIDNDVDEKRSPVRETIENEMKDVQNSAEETTAYASNSKTEAVVSDDGFDEDDDDDDDDEELAEFVPFSWNVTATPTKSSLRNKVNAGKKNVSFKKQKYHCVYEYPKEEPSYTSFYNNILHDRMMSFWNVDRDYLCSDYTSYSDWELDDSCDDQQNCSDDLLPYPPVSPPVKKNTDDKLGFYRIGSFDLDPLTMYTASDDSTTEYLPDSNHETSSTLKLESPTSPASNGTYDTPSTFNDLSSTESSPEYENPPSPELGELKHTKNRLKLDLIDNLSYTSTIADIDAKLTESLDNYGGNCSFDVSKVDLSPVELAKPFTSTSVA